jgi:hypothetical protein
VEARKDLPKRNKRVVTPQGEGKVLDVYPLKQVVVVLLDSGQRVEFQHTDIQPWDELEALRRKAQQLCAIHGDGPCSCAKTSAAPDEQPADVVEPPEQPASKPASQPPSQFPQSRGKSSFHKSSRRFKKKR